MPRWALIETASGQVRQVNAVEEGAPTVEAPSGHQWVADTEGGVEPGDTRQADGRYHRPTRPGLQDRHWLELTLRVITREMRQRIRAGGGEPVASADIGDWADRIDALLQPEVQP
jgi:hypothetical protein